MNSRVCVDAEDELRRGEESGGGGKESQEDFSDLEAQSSVSRDGQTGNVVLVLPPKDNLRAHSSTSDECIPIMVNDVPVFISHTSSGSPLYIRQYPPTLEEIMLRSPEDLIANFDGFSEASGQTFEGFSEASCSSVLFEGFSDEVHDNSKISVMQSLARIISEGVEGIQANDINDYYYEVPSKGQTQKKPRAMSSRGPSSHRRKRTRVQEKDSPDMKQLGSSTTTSPKKRMRQEEVGVETGESRCETSKSVHSRRLSVKKQESESDTALIELTGKKPRNLPSPDDPDYIGEHCNAVGCTVSFLERMAIKDVKINNGVVQELTDFACRISWEKEYVVRWIQRISGLKTQEPLEADDWKSIQAVLKRRRAISTIHSGNQYLKSKLKSFDKIEYVLPSIAKRQRTLENSEVLYGSGEVSQVMKKGQIEGEEEKEHGGTRRGVKRFSSAEENDSECNVDRKRISKGATVVEENTADKMDTESNNELGEREAISRTGRETIMNQRNKRAKVKEEDKKQFSENEEKCEIAESGSKIERRISSRRASMLALRDEKEKQTIKQERTSEVSEEVNMSQSSRRKSLIPEHDRKKQISNRIEENRATNKSKTKEVCKQERDRREDAQADQTGNETVSGRTLRSRRASMLKVKEEKERTNSEKDKTEQITEKTERAKDNDQRHRREYSNIIKSNENKQQENELQTIDKNEGVQDCKTQVRQATNNKSKIANEQKKGSDRREENESTEKHNLTHNHRTVREATVERKISSRRDRVVTKQEKGKQVIDMEEGTQNADRSRERKINRSRRASLMTKLEVVKHDTEAEKENEATFKEKEMETASKSETETSEERKSNRRGSLLVFKQEADKKATKEEIEKEVSNKKTSVRSEKETKRYKTGEVADENRNSSTVKEKQTRLKEETKKEQEEGQSSKEQNAEETLASILTDKAEDQRLIEKEGICDENHFILKRNKVINRDKRITRWQNKKMAQYEEIKTLYKEELSTKKDLTGSNEPKGHDESQQNTIKGNIQCDSNMPSDNESDGSLVMDESDDGMQIDEGTFSKQSTPIDGMSKENRVNHFENEGGLPLCERWKQSKVFNPKTDSAREEALSKQITSSPKDKTEKLRKVKGSVKGEVIKSHIAKSNVIASSEDMESKEPTLQVTTSPGNSEATLMTMGKGSAYAGTLGVSKSGRLRKASAKGIQSIEIKCLFMQRNGEAPRPPPPLPTSKDDQKDKDWMQDKRSNVKREPRDKDWLQDKRSPVKRESKDKEWFQDKKSPVKRVYEGSKSALNKMTLVTKEKGPSFNKTDNEFLTYTYRDGHLIPKFRETDYYLGDYCAQAGLTVDDLNSEKGKKIAMTFGMIKELHDFYVSRKATKTALAIRLFKMQEKKLLDNTHLLSTVMRITNVAKMKYSKNITFDREFILPVRLTSLNLPEEDEKPRKNKILQSSEASKKVSPGCVSFPSRIKRSPKKRGVKPEDSGDEYDYFGGMEDEGEVYNDILLTCGQEGAITRGDIVNLYSKWLRSKMSQGSNTFVTDLLRSVEQLMAERQVAPLRIPAGTLMSSSVKLYDEYKQILRISKEDAIMYLQEDWLEDIKYLLSISAPSRRNTSEGEAAPGGTIEAATPSALEKHSKTRTPRHRSGGCKEEDKSDFEGEPPSNTLPFKGTVKEGGSRSHQMESVGKRLGKRRSIRESLDKFEKEILLELEKEGVLEEEEEDILQQLDQEKQIYEDQLKEEEKKEKKKKREKRNLEEMDRGENKDMRKGVTTIQKNVKPMGDGDIDCEVQKIVDYQEIHDSRGKHFRYLVRWVGFGPHDDSWVDEANLQCPEILRAFWKQNKSTKQDESEPPLEENCGTVEIETGPVEPEASVESKDEEESIIQVMVKHGSAQDTACTKNTPIVTKRELLSLYDGWRQENQDELMAGSSNTVNVEVFKDRVRDLMTSRRIKIFPESLLNACFMMTLMKTRLQSRMAINKFLDTSCLEVLESSQRQYLKRKYSQIGEVLSHNHIKEQKPSVLSLQNELHNLKLDLTTAHKWRAVKNSQLGAVEEEVDCLETAVAIPDSKKKTETLLYFKQELHKLKCDLKGLEKNHDRGSNDKVSQTVQVPLSSDIRCDSESYKTNSRIVRDKLVNMSLAKSTVNTIMDIVARRMGGQCVQE